MSVDYTERKEIDREDLKPEDVAPQNKKKVPILLGASVILAFLLLQIYPLVHDFSNPPVVNQPDWDSERTYLLAKRACWDCHSNETRWPWYAKIAPLSMVLVKDVQRGREALNFSEWGAGGYASTEEIVGTITKNQMPLPYYLILHPEADLSDEERSELINGLIYTIERELPLDTDELDASSPEETGGGVEVPPGEEDPLPATEEPAAEPYE